MLRLTSFKAISATINSFCPNVQTVRWARKPRKPLWFPTAKSKLFRVPPRPQISDEERQELKRLHNNYRTQVKSLRSYFAKKYSVENLEQFDFEQHRKAVEEDFARCSEINNRWNEEVKLLREERVDMEFKETLEEAERRLKERLEIQSQQLAEAEELVRKEKDASKDFITLEKLDAAIEYAINNPVDYNFALNLDGSKIRGRETKPTKPENKEKISVKQ